MHVWLALFVALFAGSALADDAPIVMRSVTAEVQSKRFPTDDTAGPTFKAGEQVEIIIEEAGRARIRSGERYGWVPVGQLGEPIAAAPRMELDPGGLLGGLQPLPLPAPGVPAVKAQ